MLYGEYSHIVDDKCRMRIPTVFKNELSPENNPEKLVFFAFTNEVVSVYPIKVMDKLLEFTQKISPFDIKMLEYKEMLYSCIFDVEEDSHGRVLLPSKVRAKLGTLIETDENGNETEVKITVKEIVSIGMGDHIDIMTKQALEKREKKTKGKLNLRALDEMFKKYNGI